MHLAFKISIAQRWPFPRSTKNLQEVVESNHDKISKTAIYRTAVCFCLLPFTFGRPKKRTSNLAGVVQDQKRPSTKEKENKTKTRNKIITRVEENEEKHQLRPQFHGLCLR